MILLTSIIILAASTLSFYYVTEIRGHGAIAGCMTAVVIAMILTMMR